MVLRKFIDKENREQMFKLFMVGILKEEVITIVIEVIIYYVREDVVFFRREDNGWLQNILVFYILGEVFGNINFLFYKFIYNYK